MAGCGADMLAVLKSIRTEPLARASTTAFRRELSARIVRSAGRRQNRQIIDGGAAGALGRHLMRSRSSPGNIMSSYLKNSKWELLPSTFRAGRP